MTYRSPYKNIYEAAQKGTVEDIAYFIDSGVSIHATTEETLFTPLHFASCCSEPAGAQFLIDHGADVHVNDWHGETPLHYAAIHNPNVAVLQLLVDHGADVNAKNERGETPSHFAARRNSNVAVLQFLIAHGADVQVNCDSGYTLLHDAAMSNSNPVV